MALPVDVSTFTLQYGKLVDTFGGLLGVSLTITPSHELVWVATGDRVSAVTVTADATEGTFGEVQLPHTDQVGFADLKGNAITSWYYTVIATDTRQGRAVSQASIRRVQATSDVSFVDLELIPVDRQVAPIGSVPLPVVTSVNGQTGGVEITIPDVPTDILRTTDKGAPEGVAELDEDARVPEERLPDRLSEAGVTAAIDAGTDARVPGAVANALADPGTTTIVTDAADLAVTSEVNSRGLIDGSSQRIGSQVDGGGGAFGVMDANGAHTAASVRPSDGGPTDEAEQILRDRFATPMVDGGGHGLALADGSPSALQVDPATGLLTRPAADLLAESSWPYARRAAFFARTQVRVPTTSGSRPIAPSRTALAIIGDSHAAAGDVSAGSQWWYKIGQARPDLTMTHHSRGGATVHAAAMIAGAMEATFTLAGGEIPASGTVTATIQADVRYRSNTTFPDTTGVLITATEEIPVTASRVSGTTVWNFARTTPGVAIPAATARFRADAWASAGASLPIVIAGRNDQITTPTSIERAIEGYVAIMESRHPLHKKALLLGMPLDAVWVVDSAEWRFGVQLDQELARMWPDYHWSLQRWLVEDALAATGITPTSGDLDAQAKWQTPPSLLLGDGIHMNAATQAALAPKLLSILVQRDLIDPA